MLNERGGSMNEAQNTEVVKNAYAAFQRGDIGGVLAKHGKIVRVREFTDSAQLVKAYQ
jgi:ketosteroid isomerase-like protein